MSDVSKTAKTETAKTVPVPTVPAPTVPVGATNMVRVFLAAIMAGLWEGGQFMWYTNRPDKPKQKNPTYPDRVLGELDKLTSDETDRLARLLIVPTSTVGVITKLLSTRKGSSVELWSVVLDGGAKIDKGLTYHDGQGNVTYYHIDGSARAAKTVPDYAGSVEIWCERETVWKDESGKIKSEKSK